MLQNAARFDRIDILPIAGNMPLAVSFANAQRILTYADCDRSKVRLVDTSSIRQNEETLFLIHGSDGMGDILPAAYEPFSPILPFDDWLEQIEPDSVLVSLGPCTVTQKILEKTGAMPLLLMAGNISEKPNYQGYEFNHGMDKAAFAACVKYPHKIATLDTCHHPNCDFFKIENNGSTLLHRFCRQSAALSKKRGDKGAFIYDLITVRYLFEPERFICSTLTDPDGNRLNVLVYRSDEKIIDLS